MDRLTPGSPLFYGRFSNGPVWTEHMAAMLQLPLKSYAVGGAKVSGDVVWCAGDFLPDGFEDEYSCPLVPAFAVQVSDYLHSLPTGSVP